MAVKQIWNWLEDHAPNERTTSLIALIALLAAILFYGLVDRPAYNQNDAQAKVTDCVVRQVLESSRDRAEERGQLDEANRILFERAIAPLRKDCPQYLVPVDRAVEPGR